MHLLKNLLIIVAINLISLPTLAQNYKTFTRVIDGEECMCLRSPDAFDLLQMRLKYPKLQLKIEKLEEMIDLKNQEIGILDDIGANKEEQIQALVIENTRLHNKILEEDRWYNSAWFWATVGVIVGAGTAILIVYGVQETK